MRRFATLLSVALAMVVLNNLSPPVLSATPLVDYCQIFQVQNQNDLGGNAITDQLLVGQNSASDFVENQINWPKAGEVLGVSPGSSTLAQATTIAEIANYMEKPDSGMTEDGIEASPVYVDKTTGGDLSVDDDTGNKYAGARSLRAPRDRQTIASQGTEPDSG